MRGFMVATDATGRTLCITPTCDNFTGVTAVNAGPVCLPGRFILFIVLIFDVTLSRVLSIESKHLYIHVFQKYARNEVKTPELAGWFNWNLLGFNHNFTGEDNSDGI